MTLVFIIFSTIGKVKKLRIMKIKVGVCVCVYSVFFHIYVCVCIYFYFIFCLQKLCSKQNILKPRKHKEEKSKLVIISL